MIAVWFRQLLHAWACPKKCSYDMPLQQNDSQDLDRTLAADESVHKLQLCVVIARRQHARFTYMLLVEVFLK